MHFNENHEEVFDDTQINSYHRVKRNVDYVDDPNALSPTSTCPASVCLPDQCSFIDTSGNWYGNTLAFPDKQEQDRSCHFGDANSSDSYDVSKSIYILIWNFPYQTLTYLDLQLNHNYYN